MQINRASILKRASSRLFDAESRRSFHLGDNSRAPHKIAVGDHVTALDLIDCDIGQIKSCAHARLCTVQFYTVALNRTGPRLQFLRLHNDALATVKSATS